MTKHAANAITLFRIAGAAGLLLTEPMSAPFWVLYALCCLSDTLDGFVAVKTGSVSRMGAALDSAADFALIAAVLTLLLPSLKPELWMLVWAGAIAAVRLAALAVCCAKYRTVAGLHTFANKAAGMACACAPFVAAGGGLAAAAVLAGVISSVAAVEELILLLTAKELNRDVRGLFWG